MAIQLEDFAKQVLFGATLEEKLSFPREEILDTKKGSAIKTPDKLTRPKHLNLYEEGVRATHPAAAKLIDEKERGKLLHFFGNHELLATELMALAILKFPDAPASFRRGLLETLKDEQMHTQLYIHRMKQCGVEFGELPLSDYFWRSVSSMEDPLDYVTRLSLTFEQANLDYSREYAKLFETVGDSSTAAILDKIYRDEIEHVGFGLKWFRRWKAEGKTDWEAYQERLIFPLSPARAKGNVFNKEGRGEAGLEQTFISDLELFSQSRGRTPSVFWFNPEAERYAARNSAATDEPSVVQDDLAFLPAYLSRRDDLLIVEQRPGRDFLQTIKSAGFDLPEILTTPNSRSKAPEIERKIGDLRPWAWSPDSLDFFAETLSAVTRPTSPERLWNCQLRGLYSKSWSAEFGRKLAVDSNCDWIAPAEVYGEEIRSLESLEEKREQLAKAGYADLVCKSPFGTAANGNRCLLGGEPPSEPFEKWLKTVFDEQGCIVVEPWLKREYDFSVQLEQRKGKLKVVGYTRLENNPRGQFKGIITNGFCSNLDADLVQFIMRRVEGRPRVYHWFEEVLVPRLGETLGQLGFSGPLGIDAFLYRDERGKLLLKPMVELNPRYTMGRVAWEIGQRNAATSVGLFQIVSKSQLRKRHGLSFAEFAKKMAVEHPVQLTDEKKPRILSGSFPLTDTSRAKQFAAFYHVRPRFEDLPL